MIAFQITIYNLNNFSLNTLNKSIKKIFRYTKMIRHLTTKRWNSNEIFEIFEDLWMIDFSVELDQIHRSFEI